MSDNQLTLHDRLEDILESINLIQEWSEGRTTVNDFMTTPTGVMAFNACVMRLQIIGEHVGKLLKNENKPLDAYPNIPWNAIYGLRNIISHEYANISFYCFSPSASLVKNDFSQILAVLFANFTFSSYLCKRD